MNSIIALVYLSVAVILIVFGVKQIKNRKNLRKINQKQEDEVKEKIKLGILSADTVYRERTETGRVFYEVPEDLKKAVVLNLICFAIMLPSETPSTPINHAIRCVNTRVLPLPAPAKTK